ncbi:MAG TPA: serine protease, partial [Skermanella sp.]|nr:serine protease [Skermanella sp.]
MLPTPSIVSNSAGRLRKIATAALLGTTILTGAVGLPANAFAAPQAISQELPGSFADLVERVTPAVVNVSTVQGDAGEEQPRGLPGMPEFPPGSPFEEFFKQFQEQQRGARPKQHEKQQAQGSGFIVDAA